MPWGKLTGNWFHGVKPFPSRRDRNTGGTLQSKKKKKKKKKKRVCSGRLHLINESR